MSVKGAYSTAIEVEGAMAEENHLSIGSESSGNSHFYETSVWLSARLSWKYVPMFI